jgi:hypothetical protein
VVIFKATTLWNTEIGSIILLPDRVGFGIASRESGYRVPTEGSGGFADLKISVHRIWSTKLIVWITISITRFRSAGCFSISNVSIVAFTSVGRGVESREISNTMSISVAIRAFCKAAINTKLRVPSDVGAMNVRTGKGGQSVDSSTSSSVTDHRERADTSCRDLVHESFAVSYINKTSIRKVWTRMLSVNSLARRTDKILTDGIRSSVGGGGRQKEITCGISDIVRETDFSAGGVFETDVGSGDKSFGDDVKLLGGSVPQCAGGDKSGGYQ